MKYIFIINDISGKGKAKKLEPNIEAQCKNKNIDYEIRHISKEKSGYDIAMEYKDQENIIYVSQKGFDSHLKAIEALKEKKDNGG